MVGWRKGASISKEKFLRINERIRFSPIVVIDDMGDNLGQMSTIEAMNLAREKGVDLVEINPTARPPICKIMDYGKFKYDQSKKEKESKSRQKETELKEIRLTAKIGDHDIEYKARQAKDFFDKGSKVKVSMRLRGRENVFADRAVGVFHRFAEKAGLAYEKNPVRAGNQIVGMLSTKLKEDKS